MPSQYSSHPQTPPLPHLSDIIKLKQEGDHRCLGFAYTQGRRCLNNTNARDRKTAVSLLYKGTRDLHQGHHIDGLLEDLAPLVLCRRWHQNQAAEFVETWQRRVRRFERSCNTPAPVAPSQSPRTTTSTSTSTSARRSSSGQQDLGVEHLERRLHDTRVGFERSYNMLAPVASSQPPRTTTSTSASSSARRSSSGQQEPAVEHLERRLHDMREELERLRATVSGTQSTVQNLNPTSNGQARASSASVRPAVRPADVAGANTASGNARSRRTSSTRSSGSTVSSPVTLSSVPISPASTSLTSPLDGMPRHVRRTAGITLPSSRAGDATRRPIEGECGICLNLLRRTRSRAGSSSGNEVVGVDTAEDTDSGYEEESEEETGADEGLTWCRAQCGVNYHAECIGEWLQESRHRNCPTCRSGWIE